MSRAWQLRPKPVISLLACSNEKKKGGCKFLSWDFLSGIGGSIFTKAKYSEISKEAVLARVMTYTSQSFTSPDSGVFGSKFSLLLSFCL